MLKIWNLRLDNGESYDLEQVWEEFFVAPTEDESIARAKRKYKVMFDEEPYATVYVIGEVTEIDGYKFTIN